MLTSCALSIEFHIILVIVLMTIHVFYISIIYYKLLPMFMIHVSFIHISSSLFTCVMLAFSKEADTRKDCMYPRILSQYAIVLSIYIVLYDPNGVIVMTQTRPTISVCYNNCIPNRHPHLSIYLVISRQSVLLHFQYISHIHYCYHVCI